LQSGDSAYLTLDFYYYYIVVVGWHWDGIASVETLKQHQTNGDESHRILLSGVVSLYVTDFRLAYPTAQSASAHSYSATITLWYVRRISRR
jgi:hypothetical protein